MVGEVWTTSFIKNWYRIVVFPALSSPTKTILCSEKSVKEKIRSWRFRPCGDGKTRWNGSLPSLPKRFHSLARRMPIVRNEQTVSCRTMNLAGELLDKESNRICTTSTVNREWVTRSDLESVTWFVQSFNKSKCVVLWTLLYSVRLLFHFRPSLIRFKVFRLRSESFVHWVDTRIKGNACNWKKRQYHRTRNGTFDRMIDEDGLWLTIKLVHFTSSVAKIWSKPFCWVQQRILLQVCLLYY